MEKSVKSDDAEVPVDLWNKEIFLGSESGVKYQPNTHAKLLEVLREKLAMRWFRKRLFSSFCTYMRNEYGMSWVHQLKMARIDKIKHQTEIFKDADVALDAISRGVNANWWTWTEGSTLFFWRWPKEVRKDARDDSSFPWKFYPLPAYRIPQKYPKDEEERKMRIDKLMVPINRGYISPGLVKSLSGFFAVPKGPTDIRLVYDMTKCGLNKCLWSPRFYLPVPDSLFDLIEYNSFMPDIDQGEMFLNYFSDPELVSYMGVNVTEAVASGDSSLCKKRVWMRWNRWDMGVRQSPYATTRMYAISLEIIKVNRRDHANPFNWDYVELNLPSSESYDPSQPWVSKRTKDGNLSSDCFVFVDDGRVLGRTQKTCNNSTRRVASVMNHLGEQDASRKRRGASQNSGAWVGALFRSDNDTIGLATSQDKWDKGKNIITKWLPIVKNSE